MCSPSYRNTRLPKAAAAAAGTHTLGISIVFSVMSATVPVRRAGGSA